MPPPGNWRASLPGRPTWRSHAYGTAAGDAIALAQERVRQGKSTLQQIWPVDGVHPGDAGYTLFADAAWLAFQQAVREKKTCTLPEKMLYAPTYLASARVRLSSLGPLPEGSRVGVPNVVSAYFDMLMSRGGRRSHRLESKAWCGAGQDQGVSGGEGCSLRLRFRGSMVMLFGESTMKSGSIAPSSTVSWSSIVRGTLPGAARFPTPPSWPTW